MITQHFNTAQHRRGLKNRSSTSKQLLSNMVVNEDSNLSELQYVQSPFNIGLCEALLSGLYPIDCECCVCFSTNSILLDSFAADIPLYKIQNMKLREFLTKYMNPKIPKIRSDDAFSIYTKP